MANNYHNLCDFITISVDTSRIKDTHTKILQYQYQIILKVKQRMIVRHFLTYIQVIYIVIIIKNILMKLENYALNLMDNTASSINDIKTACCNTMSCRDHNLQNLDAFSTSNENANCNINPLFHYPYDCNENPEEKSMRNINNNIDEITSTNFKG